MEKATIFDYDRMCNFYGETCQHCPLEYEPCGYGVYDFETIEKTVRDWCKEHPIETFLDHFKKMFPNCEANGISWLPICPQLLNKNFSCNPNATCEECKKKFWNSEYTGF